MRALHQMNIATAHQINGQAVVDVQHPIGVGLGPVAQHLLLAFAHGFLFVAGDHQQVVVGFTKAIGLVTAKVDEVQVVRPSSRGQMAEFDFPAVDALHGHPGIDMYTLGAAEPVGAQLRVGRFQRVRDRKHHIVHFNLCPWVLAPEHDDKQHYRFFL